MTANNRPCLNRDSKAGSILAVNFRSVKIRWTWLDCFFSPSPVVASASVGLAPLKTGVAYYGGGHENERDGSPKGTHVSLVPLPEGSGIDFDNSALDQGLGSEQLVVGGVVDLSYPTAKNQAMSHSVHNSPFVSPWYAQHR